MEIDRSRLSEQLKNEIERIGLLRPVDILEKEEIDFLSLGNFTLEDVYTLKTEAAHSVVPYAFKTVSDIIGDTHLWVKIPSECPEIDEALGGGLPLRHIIELSGESGLGKTQFGLQFSITAQYPHHGDKGNWGVVYICTEERFPATRLHQMSQFFPRSADHRGKIANFGDFIYVAHCSDVEGFRETINIKLFDLLEKRRIKLIVIDSIAAIFRTEYTVKQSALRAKELRSVGLSLHKIARRYNTSVLCINQVSDVVDGEGKVPALGLAWANLTTTRLSLSRRGDTKLFQVRSSPDLPPAEVPYTITEEGIKTTR